MYIEWNQLHSPAYAEQRSQLLFAGLEVFKLSNGSTYLNKSSLSSSIAFTECYYTPVTVISALQYFVCLRKKKKWGNNILQVKILRYVEISHHLKLTICKWNDGIWTQPAWKAQAFHQTLSWDPQMLSAHGEDSCNGWIYIIYLSRITDSIHWSSSTQKGHVTKDCSESIPKTFLLEIMRKSIPM